MIIIFQQPEKQTSSPQNIDTTLDVRKLFCPEVDPCTFLLMKNMIKLSFIFFADWYFVC